MFFLYHMGVDALPGAVVARWWDGNNGSGDKKLDLRWLLMGSSLPDLVDKPVGQLFFKSRFQNGRIFCHTLLFASAMFAAGLGLKKRKGDDRVLLMAIGVVSHLLFDKIWGEPETVFWPALGPFRRDPTTLTLMRQIIKSLSDPSVWREELEGAILLFLASQCLGIRGPSDLVYFLSSGQPPALAPSEEGL